MPPGVQQEQGKVETGQVLTTRILDVNKHDGIIDLTTKAALLAALSAGSQPSGGKLKACLPHVLLLSGMPFGLDLCAHVQSSTSYLRASMSATMFACWSVYPQCGCQSLVGMLALTARTRCIFGLQLTLL